MQVLVTDKVNQSGVVLKYFTVKEVDFSKPGVASVVLYGFENVDLLKAGAFFGNEFVLAIEYANMRHFVENVFSEIMNTDDFKTAVLAEV